MTKKELLKCIATKTKQPMTNVDAMLSEMVTCITKALAKGGKLSIPGLGTFSRKKRAARVGRNPQNGKTIKIPAKKVPHFSAGKALKETINK